MQPWQQGQQQAQHSQQQAQHQQQLAFLHSRTQRSRSIAAGCAGALVCLVIVLIVAYLVFTLR
jgi:hypothetical protein